jgi:DNA-binding CsgD family transcriptional regulator
VYEKDRGCSPRHFEGLLIAFRCRYWLTARETEVLRLGCLGLSSKETAAQLGCSPKTVDEHWRRIYKKWRLSSRAKIVADLLAEALTADVDEGEHARRSNLPQLNPAADAVRRISHSGLPTPRKKPGQKKAQPTLVGRAFRLRRNVSV